MNKTFWWGLVGSVLGGIAVLYIGAKYFAIGTIPAGATGGGGPANAGALPVTAYSVYPDTQSQPSWAFPDPNSDLYNAGHVTTNDAGRAGTQDYFGTPLGRRTDVVARTTTAQTVRVN